MNERQIRKLRNQFILISTLSFFGVMLLMGGLIYAFSEFALRNEVRDIMTYIAEHENEITVLQESMAEAEAEVVNDSAVYGTNDSTSSGEEDSSSTEVNNSLPAESSDSSAAEGTSSTSREEEDVTRIVWSLPRLFGREGLYDDTLEYLRTTSFFAVLFDAEGEVQHVTMNLMFDMDEQQVVRYARHALNRLLGFGNTGRYYYNVFRQEDGSAMVIYVDRTGQVAVNNRVLFAALILLGAGTLLAFFLMRVLSMRVVRSEVENADRQKRFITNASHELKTPLAVIRANTEMQEMMVGETEWTASTLRQVERMSGLVENLVKIARSGEQESLQMTQVDITRVTSETCDSFRPVAAGDGKTLETDIADPLIIVTDESALRQLMTLLLDNAVKYCDPEGYIRCSARKSGKGLEIQVSNSYAEGASVDYQRFFDRFYREDASHNTEKGGYGIGLSIAESLVKSLHGKLNVSWKDGLITFQAWWPEAKLSTRTGRTMDTQSV